jgi:propionyl-CoA synthetase
LSTKFDRLYNQSLLDPENFWAEAANDISWNKCWEKVLNDSNSPHLEWFFGGELNTCFNCVDRHVNAGLGEQAAVIYDSAVTGTKRTLTYSALQEQVSRFSGALSNHQVQQGDRVIIYMAMIPEALIAALACARIGAVHTIVFGGFAANELSVRIDDCKPKVIVSSSCGIEPNRIVSYKPLLDKAIELAHHKPKTCIIVQRPEQQATLNSGRDITWSEAMETAEPRDCVSVKSTDPLYILYTSGTTGQPKGVVRDNGGHAVALHWSMKNIYNVAPGEVYWAASDMGWVVGHSYIIYGPLLRGCTTVIYEGKPVGTPDPGAFWRVISEHNVSVMFTAPTAIRAIRQQDPNGSNLDLYNLGNLRTVFLAGERCDPDTLKWLEDKLHIPIIDHWWQTETGWAISANCLGIEPLPIVPGSPGRACPGWDIHVLDASGDESAAGTIGAICIKLPLPPGAFSTLWKADQRYRDSYFKNFEGYYETGDAGMINENGYVYVMSRTDDVINVAGHRLSTGALEEVLIAHPDVAECAVIGPADPLKGQLPVGFIVLNFDSNQAEKIIIKSSLESVRDKIGAIAALKNLCIVSRLPKTRSGKILRGTMKKIADGDAYKTPATIEEPEVLTEISDALEKMGYPKNSQKPNDR